MESVMGCTIVGCTNSMTYHHQIRACTEFREPLPCLEVTPENQDMQMTGDDMPLSLSYVREL